jgi:hypothetical protein
VPPPLWLAEHTPTERTETIEASSLFVSDTPVAGSADADRENRGQNSALYCHDLHHSGCLSPRRQRKQRPEQRPQLSFRKHIGWLGPRRKRKHRPSAPPTCQIRHHGGWLSPRSQSEQRPKQRPHLSCLPPILAG